MPSAFEFSMFIVPSIFEFSMIFFVPSQHYCPSVFKLPELNSEKLASLNCAFSVSICRRLAHACPRASAL